MSTFAAWVAVMMGAAVEINIAPDQPIPHVYVDDPLIIELNSSVDAEARIELEVKAAHHTAPTIVGLESVALQAGGSYWWAVENIPTDRGRYQVRIKVELDGHITETDATFCRVDRPVSGDYTLPVCVHLEDFDTRTLLALKSVSIQFVRLDADMPGLEQRIEELSAMGLRAAIRIDTEHLEDAEARAEALSKALGGQVVRWEVDPRDDPAALACVARALRRGVRRARQALVTTGPEHLKRMLDAGAGRFVDGLVFHHDAPPPTEIAALRTAAEQAGYEGMPLNVSGRVVTPGNAEEGAPLIQQTLLNLASGVVQTEIASALVFDRGLSESYVHLSAMAHRLKNAVYVGSLDVPAPVEALVFRADNQWLIVIWAGGESQGVTLPVGEATDLVLTNVRNDPMTPPGLQEGEVMLWASPAPQFLSGQGGSVLLEAAWGMAQKEARTFTKTQSDKQYLPTEAIDVATAIAAADAPAANRLDFFTLLQTFPYIESQWHAQELPRAVAVPAMASLARLARHLCAVEQVRGKPFIEPLQDTLARCREYQSLYLTGSTTSSERQGRGDRLLEEVNRLMAEAEYLEASGRSIEADAVAAMAEWRARSIEDAAKAAPLYKPDPLEANRRKPGRKEE